MMQHRRTFPPQCAGGLDGLVNQAFSQACAVSSPALIGQTFHIQSNEYTGHPEVGPGATATQRGLILRKVLCLAARSPDRPSGSWPETGLWEVRGRRSALQKVAFQAMNYRLFVEVTSVDQKRKIREAVH
jgi:hypothetical protein